MGNSFSRFSPSNTIRIAQQWSLLFKWQKFEMFGNEGKGNMQIDS